MRSLYSPSMTLLVKSQVQHNVVPQSNIFLCFIKVRYFSSFPFNRLWCSYCFFRIISQPLKTWIFCWLTKVQIDVRVGPQTNIIVNVNKKCSKINITLNIFDWPYQPARTIVSKYSFCFGIKLGEDDFVHTFMYNP